MQILKEAYPEGGTRGVVDALQKIGIKRKPDQVKFKANTLKIKYNKNYPRWCDQELEIIRQYYPKYGSKRVYEELAKFGFSRNLHMIRYKACFLGLKCSYSVLGELWSDESIKILEAYYPDFGAQKVHYELKRIGIERSLTSIKNKARKRKIKCYVFDTFKSWSSNGVTPEWERVLLAF